jgi:hypothetical protein
MPEDIQCAEAFLQADPNEHVLQGAVPVHPQDVSTLSSSHDSLDLTSDGVVMHFARMIGTRWLQLQWPRFSASGSWATLRQAAMPRC